MIHKKGRRIFHLNLRVIIACKILRLHIHSTALFYNPRVLFEEFSLLVESLAATPNRCLIIGDFNFSIATTDNNAVQFLDLIDSGGLHQHVTSPTHNRGHILDLVITSASNLVITSAHR